MTAFALDTGTLLHRRAPAGAAVGPDQRDRRIRFLLSLVVILSGIDLLITLAFMKTLGLAETNPLVVSLMHATGSAAALALFKLFTVVTPVALIYCARRASWAEPAAWISVAVLCGVLIQWVRYASYVAAVETPVLMQMGCVDGGWVAIP